MESTRILSDLGEMGTKIMHFFSEAEVERVAQDTKFVQRRSRLTGLRYLKTLVFGYIENPKASLSDLAEVCADLEVKISPQGLDERINTASVSFLQTIFQQAIQVFQNRLRLVLPILKQFSGIQIVDSTVLALPEEMQDHYPGCGGHGPAASLKIQLVFDFLCGNLKQILLQAGRLPDQAYRDYLELVQAGSLTLVDLGYFCLDAFRAIADMQAYFLSRYLYPAALLTPAGERIQLLPWLRAETRASLDRPVLLGCRRPHRIPCRLIAVQAAPPVAEERRRKALQKARLSGRVPTQEYLDLLAWSLFLTNVPQECLSLEQVLLFYRVRWQIELIFKLWKSYCGLNAIGLWRRERILTELYAKMIASVLFQFLIMPLRIPDEAWANRELSSIRSRLILARFARQLNQSLSDSTAFYQILRQMMDHCIRFGLKQKRRTRPNICQRLATSLA
ncbi:MAG TPA: IS4 family transposase [Anaerolineales bacterium]|nr:IS4 family transposase [Anaerolineales bacterium]